MQAKFLSRYLNKQYLQSTIKVGTSGKGWLVAAVAIATIIQEIPV